MLSEPRKAIEYYEQALDIAREIGDRRGEGADLGNLGNAYSDLGEARKAIEYYEQALAIAREIGDRRGEGDDLGNLGSAYADLGEARKAIEYYEQALAICSRDRRPTGAKEPTWATWALPTRIWARLARPSSTTSRLWPSHARSVTDGAKETPWATWGMPTPIWARLARPSSTTSRPGHRPRDRRPTGRRSTPGQPGAGLL